MDDIVAEIIGTRIPKLQNVKLRQEGKFYLALPISDNSRNVISLNETAIRILSLCDGCNDINAIARTIAQQYDAEFKTVLNGAVKLIQSLEGTQIVSTNLQKRN